MAKAMRRLIQANIKAEVDVWAGDLETLQRRLGDVSMLMDATGLSLDELIEECEKMANPKQRKAS